MTYSTLSMQTQSFLAMTGLTPAEFQDLLPAFEAAYEHARQAYRRLITELLEVTHERSRADATAA